jgi:hypothetical protein
LIFSGLIGSSRFGFGLETEHSMDFAWEQLTARFYSTSTGVGPACILYI